MIRLSKEAYVEVARLFSTAEAFAMFLWENEQALKRDRAQRRLARQAVQTPDSVRVSESGFVSPPQVTGGIQKELARHGLLRPGSGLKGARLAVAALIIDECRLRSGRCELGLGTMAGRLGLSERSVRREVKWLDENGLIARAVHGGRHHANAYTPNFAALARLGLAVANPDTETKPGHNRTPESAKTESPSPTLSSPRKSQRAPDRRQREMMLPVVVQGGKAGAAQGAIAREQAELRLGVAYRTHLHKLGEAAGRELKGSVTAEDWETGLVAETARRGSGLQAMLDAGFVRWSAENKPPSAATG